MSTGRIDGMTLVLTAGRLGLAALAARNRGGSPPSPSRPSRRGNGTAR
jgi:hypothetical protein